MVHTNRFGRECVLKTQLVQIDIWAALTGPALILMVNWLKMLFMTYQQETSSCLNQVIELSKQIPKNWLYKAVLLGGDH